MNIRTKPPSIFTSREFNQDIARAKRAAHDGPVFITSRGEPTHVLITKEEFDRLEKAPETSPKQTARPKNLAEMLAHPESAHIDFEPPRLTGELFRRIDFD